jgi:hypothetical protein
MPFEPNFPPPKKWAPEGAGLTHRQLAAIGAVITTWALLEATVQQMLFTLAQSPSWLGQALTEDLGPDHRLKALRRLLRTWERLLGYNDGHEAELEKVHSARALAIWIEKNKDRRNRVAHWLWNRASDEEMYAFKYTLKGGGSGVGLEEAGLWIETTADELMSFAEEIRAKVDAIAMSVEDLRTLPTWPERLS